MYQVVNGGRSTRGRRRSLGTTSTLVDGSLIYGSDAVGGPVSPSSQPFLSQPAGRRRRRFRDWWQNATNNQDWWAQETQPIEMTSPGYYAGLSGVSRKRLGLVVAPTRLPGGGVLGPTLQQTVQNNPARPVVIVGRLPGGSMFGPTQSPSSPISPAWGVYPPLVGPVGPVPVTTSPWWSTPPQLPGAGSGPVQAPWGGNPSWGGAPPWTAGNSPYGSSPLSPYGSSGYGSSQSNAQALATAQALLATNPSLLSPQQYQLLVQAGLISSSTPYSSLSQIAPTVGTASLDTSNAIDPTTGVPYATELAEAEAGGTSAMGTTLSTEYGGIPLWGWLIGGGGLVIILMKRR
jgi:hypothetical protein